MDLAINVCKRNSCWQRSRSLFREGVGGASIPTSRVSASCWVSGPWERSSLHCHNHRHLEKDGAQPLPAGLPGELLKLLRAQLRPGPLKPQHPGLGPGLRFGFEKLPLESITLPTGVKRQECNALSSGRGQKGSSVLSPLRPLTSPRITDSLPASPAASPSHWPISVSTSPQPSLLPSLPASRHRLQSKGDLPLPCSQASPGSPGSLATVSAPSA